MPEQKYGAMTSSVSGIDAATLLPQMKLAMLEFEARWPKRKRPKRIEVGPEMMAALERQVPKVQSAGPFGSLLIGLPIDIRYDLPRFGTLTHMQDGSSVMTYRSGFEMRCPCKQEQADE